MQTFHRRDGLDCQPTRDCLGESREQRVGAPKRSEEKEGWGYTLSMLQMAKTVKISAVLPCF